MKKVFFIFGIVILFTEFSSAATYDISAEGSCNYGETEVEASTGDCWSVYQTATYNSSQQVNTALSVYISRSSFVVGRNTSDFNLAPACGSSCYYPMRTYAKVSSSGTEITAVESGQATNISYLNTGLNPGATNIIFTTYLTTNIGCPVRYGYCAVETPIVNNAPITITSASIPCVRVAFGNPPTPCQ